MSARDIRQLLRRPVIVAPMAGGPSTPDLVVAAGRAGGLGFLAGGYKSAAAVTAEIAAVRAASGEPFGVNLFVPGTPSSAGQRLGEYVASLAADATAVGGTLGEATWDDDGWEQKLTAVLASAPPLVSLTFGCPSTDIVAAFQSAGCVVGVTITTPREAQLATAAGADVLCVQGIEAGAHRGTFGNHDRAGQDYGLLALISEVAQVTSVPQLAAGGIVRAGQLRAVLAAGAIAAQCGTAFLRCPESGARPAHKLALADKRFTLTALTRAFSGRRARGLVNRFMLEHADAPAAYPEIHNATRDLRAAAPAAATLTG